MDWEKVYHKNANWLDKQAEIIRIKDRLMIMRGLSKCDWLSDELMDEVIIAIQSLKRELNSAERGLTVIERDIRECDPRPLLYVRDELFDDYDYERELDKNGFIRGYKF